MAGEKASLAMEFLPLISVLLILMIPVLFFAGLVTLVLVLHRHGSTRQLEQWAAQHGLQLVQHQWSPFDAGRFPFQLFDRRQTFRVVVVDQAGYQHAGWVRCANLFINRTEVVWEY